MDEIKYEEYYVAYMDILGFKNIVGNDSISSKEIYEILTESKNNYLETITKDDQIVISFEEIKVYVMSDSVIYYIKTSAVNALITLISICSCYIGMLATRSIPILVRGAISKGNLIAKDNVIFGPALSNAYQMENDNAIYPRIIIDGNLKYELRDALSTSNPQKQYLEKIIKFTTYMDEDEWLCVKNILFSVPMLRPYVDRYNDFVLDQLNKIQDKRIRDKYLYLAKFYRKNVKLDK